MGLPLIHDFFNIMHGLKLSVLQSVGSQRVGHDWATELSSTEHLENVGSMSSVGFPDVDMLPYTIFKTPPANAQDTRDMGSIPGSGRSPWSRKWLLIPMFLPGKFHGQRSLAGYCPWGRKESDTAKQLSTPRITPPLISEKSLTVRRLPSPRW